MGRITEQLPSDSNRVRTHFDHITFNQCPFCVCKSSKSVVTHRHLLFLLCEDDSPTGPFRSNHVLQCNVQQFPLLHREVFGWALIDQILHGRRHFFKPFGALAHLRVRETRFPVCSHPALRQGWGQNCARRRRLTRINCEDVYIH